jgi:hypothetical protein
MTKEIIISMPPTIVFFITWCDEDLWDETLMIIRPCHQLLKAKNDMVVGG